MTNRRLQKFLFIMLIPVFIWGCEDKKSSSGDVATTPTTPTTPVVTDPEEATPGTVQDSGGFNIKVNPPKGTSYTVHKRGDFTKKCVVEKDAALFVDQDIECTVEVEELVGAFNGIEMVLNVPKEMCDYVLYTPYYFFGLQYGVGPTAGSLVTNEDGTVVSSSVTGPGTIVNETLKCNYDYSDTDGGPDCCLGAYTFTRTTNNDNPATKKTVVTVSNWTGKPGNCVAGAGSKADRDKLLNLPLRKVYSVPQGLSQTFSVEKSLTMGFGSLYYANYYPAATPAAFMLSDTYKGSPYYEWVCLDNAYEYKARIRVQIQEWNEVEEYDLEAAGDPDTTGLETDWGNSINDFTDWLDIINAGDGFPGMPPSS